MTKPIINSNAPRMGKKEFSSRIITKDLYKKFKEEHPEYKEMKWKEFEELWADITQTIRTETVYNPLGVKLPYYLGELKLQFLPYKFKATNIALSNELGEKTNQLNIVTKGKTAKLKWERRFAVRFNKMLQFYGFEPDRKMNQLANKYVPENAEKIRTSRVTTGGKRKW